MPWSVLYEYKEIPLSTAASRSRAPYLIAVSTIQDITTHLRRITYTVPDLRFYSANAAAYNKVF